MAPILKTSLIFVFLLYLMKRRCPLGPAMLIGATALGFCFGMPAKNIVKSVSLTIISRPCLELMAILILILILSHFLEGTHQIERLTKALKARVKDSRITAAALPALIGLLPMLGGALFSAPLVEGATKSLKINSVKKALVNYWFRHIWEYSWPLYPGIVLASELTGVDLSRLVLLQLPLTGAALLAGMIFIFRGIPREENREDDPREHPSGKRLIADSSPFFLIICLALILRIHLVIALLVAILIVIVTNKIGLRSALSLVKRGLSWKIATAAIGIMAFKGLLESTGAISAIASSLKEYTIAPQLLILCLPFLVGLFTGITLGPVGIIFPILLPLFQSDHYRLSYIVLAFASGFAGVLLSPVHLCLLLTRDYFEVDMRGIYRGLMVPVFFTILVGILLFFIYGR